MPKLIAKIEKNGVVLRKMQANYADNSHSFYYEDCFGRVQGKYVSYYRSGNLKCKRVFKNGKIVGDSLEYFNNKKRTLKAKLSYDENGLIQGKGYWYWKNGNVRQVQYFKNDKIHGAVLFYNKQGEIINTDTYIENKRV
jgi:antitoxin component YwqK of YwqJK toxin-antitoxin module